MSAPGGNPGRLAALIALLAAAFVAVALGILLMRHAVTLLFVVAAVAVAAAAAWLALTRRGAVRVVAEVVVIAALIGGAVMMIARGAVDELVVFVIAGGVFGWAARKALRAAAQPSSPAQPSTRRPAAGTAVLLLNPKSGGGKVGRFDLVEEAKRRGIEPVVLGPDDDLRTLAEEAAASADVIGMAGGDGSQALVAQVAMERGLDYVCIPAGTRNHLALDLGLDRDDVVGALDAFASDDARRVDLAFVNDRIFVNNVSLGVYAEIVQSDAYRDDKLKTVEKMLPELLGPRATPFDLRFRRGRRHRAAFGAAASRLEQPVCPRSPRRRRLATAP